MLKNQLSVSTSRSRLLIMVGGLFILALITTLIVATSPTLAAQWFGSTSNTNAVVQPTACPDAIACHAIKRNAAIETAAPAP